MKQHLPSHTWPGGQPSMIRVQSTVATLLTPLMSDEGLETGLHSASRRYGLPQKGTEKSYVVPSYYHSILFLLLKLYHRVISCCTVPYPCSTADTYISASRSESMSPYPSKLT